MTDTSPTTSQKTAEEALLKLIADAVASIEESDYEAHSYASGIKSLAVAYRLVVGGPQPTLLDVDSKD